MISYSCGHTAFDTDPLEERDERCPSCVTLTRISAGKRDAKRKQAPKRGPRKRG